MSSNPTPVISWLLSSPEPWTRFRTLVELLALPEGDERVVEAHREMLTHPQVRGLIDVLRRWDETPLKRHNDSTHPIYCLLTLTDFGLRLGDPGVEPLVEKLLRRQSPEGAFESLLHIPEAFGGTGEDNWAWMACDAPVVLYALGLLVDTSEPRLHKAAEHLNNLVQDNGWRCAVAPILGKFRGPGRKADPCPIANLAALPALALFPETRHGAAVRAGGEMLLSHWEHQAGPKLYMFGIGSDFRKLKYPFVWYDILHVTDVLSRFPFVHNDPRFQQMVEVVLGQADAQGRYTPGSMYQAWKGWSFAAKKTPSPWLTFCVLRMAKRVGL